MRKVALALTTVIAITCAVDANAHMCGTCVKEKELHDYAETCKQAQFNYRMGVSDRLESDTDYSIVKMVVEGWEFNAEEGGMLKVCPGGSVKSIALKMSSGSVYYRCITEKSGEQVGAVDFNPQMMNTVDDRKVQMVRYIPSCNVLVGYIDKP